MGRHVKPKSDKILAGTYRPHRDAGGRLVIPSEAPTCPRGAPRIVRRLFDATVEYTLPWGTLTPADGETLLQWCIATLIARKYGYFLIENDAVYLDSNQGTAGGRPAKRPEFQVWRDAVGVSDRLGAKLGLTPLDRMRLLAGMASDDDEGDMLDLRFKEIMASGEF